mgnify:CR=1 FL=1
MHLDKTKLIDITLYLENHELITARDVVVYAEKPGEGNMNYTLRVKTEDDKSLIIKQAFFNGIGTTFLIISQMPIPF